MPTPTTTVIRELERFGRKLGAFVQANEGDHLVRGQVDEGYCNGICIDWARRVLQGGKATFTDKEERKGIQAVRQATIQMRIESNDETHSAVINTRNALAGAFNQHLDGSPVPITSQLENDLLRYIQFQPAPNRTYDNDRVERWLSLLEEVADTYNHRTETGFAEFVRAIDAAHIEFRQQQERGPSTRPFNHIKILKSTARQPYPSVATAANQLLQLNIFAPDTVLLLGFGLVSRNRNTGHAVAFHRVDNTTYRFLDPNYGMFEYNLQGAYSALIYLFGAGYGAPIYGEDGDQVTGAVSHIVFGLA